MESSKLTTFNTHKGRFRYKKRPYGMRSSQDIYQKKMDQAFYKCKGAFEIADDIQVYGNNTIHDMHLHEAVERTRQAELKLNYDKCVIKTKSCTFFGNVYTPQGMMPDPKRWKPSKRCRHHKLNKNCNLLRYGKLSRLVHHTCPS